MSTRGTLSFPLLALLATGLVAEHSADAQGPPPFPLQYTAQVMCGRSPSRDAQQVLARATFHTTVNVHNPFGTPTDIRKRFVIPRPGDNPKDDPVVSPFFADSVAADAGLEITCQDIADLLGVDLAREGLFLRGFVVVESRSELDVVAVYTSEVSGGFFGGRRATTLHVEPISARRLGQPDLIPLPDDTGNFCKRDSSGRLIITVRNAGIENASPSVTRLDFANGDSQPVVTPGIPAAGTVDVFATIPAACFSRDCTFRIAVDSTALVSESNEGNNAAGGTCVASP
jgi:hypothetical protein